MTGLIIDGVTDVRMATGATRSDGPRAGIPMEAGCQGEAAPKK
jgi:hypothetical protein